MMIRTAFMLMALSAIGQIQAQRFHHMHGDTVRDIVFATPMRGFTAEDGAKTRYTTDGGLTWAYGEIQAVETTPALQVPMRRVCSATTISTKDGWSATEGSC